MEHDINNRVEAGIIILQLGRNGYINHTISDDRVR